MPQTLIVGDLHGCLGELEDLIAAGGLSKKRGDRLISVGDLVAKGPDSHGVVKLLRGWKADAVRGNHDAYLLKYRSGGEAQLKKEQRAVAKSLSEADWKFLESQPLFLRLPGLIVVHAGLVPGVPLEKQEEAAMISMRSIDAQGRWSKRIEDGVPWASLWPGPERVIFGHDAVRGLQQWPHALGLDTGCVYGRKLTGLLLPEDRLISVPARQEWVSSDD
jgi:diadenosine tetraphosphatase ApaH/serine/threonine PP2A family protein phosphatase